jgi:hypothetical protein
MVDCLSESSATAMESLMAFRVTLIFRLGEKGHVVKNEVKALKKACDDLGGTPTRHF